MKTSDVIKRLRETYNLTQEELGKIAGVSFQAVSLWERGERDPRMGAVQRMADYFGLKKSDIIEGACFEDNIRDLPSNAVPLKRRMIPILGNVAAGQPIWADEEHDEFVDDNGTASADFALRVKGDSMSPLIEDGDFVYVKRQETVRNGQIAVVLDGDSATLKYLYVNGDTVQLASHNPAYPPMVYTGDKAEGLRIEGLAVAFKRSLIRK